MPFNSTKLLLRFSSITVLLFICFIGNGQLKPGRLTGVIRDDNNSPIANVNVALENVKRGTTTSVSGDYVLVLAPGTYTVLFSAVNYAPQRVTDIIIKSNEQTDLSITLGRSKKDTLSGVVVSSTARRASINGLLLVQKNASGLQDGISAEQMGKVPDANIAKVLKRVSGLTVQGEKFVTIRGISDRYINVMINGSILPSTEPNRRNFSFDIVPSALVDNVIVNKTATPDLSGEFTGGIVQVFTKDVPVKNFLQLSIGTGINTASFDKPFKSFERDKNASIGKINPDRLWFGDGRLIDPAKYLRDDTTGVNKSLRGQIPNAWQMHRYGYLPVQNYQLSGGVSKRFENSSSLGVIAAVTYLNEQLTEEGQLGLSGRANYNSVRNKYNTSIGALLNSTFKTKKHKISWKNLYNLRYSDQYDEKNGYHYDFSVVHTLQTNVTLQNKLFQTRLEGEHVLTSGNIKIDWAADLVQLKREQPHSRGLISVGDPAGYDFAYLYKGLLGLYNAVLDEKRKNVAVNLSFPFKVKNLSQLLKVGYAYTRRSSDLNAALFYIFSDSLNQLPKGLPYYQVATPENFRNGLLTFRQFSNSVNTAGDSYNGTQDLHSVYAMADLRFFKKFRFIGGVRNENNTSTVSTLFYTYPALNVLRILDSTQKYVENDLMPSFNLVYSLTNKINIRAAFSKTVARPELVERSPYLYLDVAEQIYVTGQKSLEVSRINNYDLRFEYYPSPGEIFSVSAFLKDFDKPVERIYLLGTGTPGIQYRNMKSARAKGFEVDFRKSLSFISSASKFFSKLTLNGNFSYIDGKVVDLVIQQLSNPLRDSIYEVNANRPLQGLSPYIINAGISYDDTNWGLNLAFNRSGRRNLTGGGDFLATQYENPRSILDFQINGKLFKQKVDVKLNISDILNQPFVIYTNIKKQDASNNGTIEVNNDPMGDKYNKDLDFENYKVIKGIGISLNVTYKF